MITNEAELAKACENLASIEAAIDSLRRELLPNHESNFNLYAGPWLDMQQEFQADIDAYLANRAASRNGAPHSSQASESQPVELK